MSESREKSALEKFLTLFTDIRSGEGVTAAILTLNIFLLLTAYYIVKPVREALILVGGGAEVKSYAAAGQGLLLLGAVPLYAMLATRLPRLKLINIVTLFFTACLAGFYILAQFNVPLGIVFYLWVGIFNLMVIAQFWSFTNDIYTPDEGKRLFPLVAFGASAGAVGGRRRGLGAISVLHLVELPDEHVGVSVDPRRSPVVEVEGELPVATHHQHWLEARASQAVVTTRPAPAAQR